MAFIYGAAFALVEGRHDLAPVLLHLSPAVLGLQAWVPDVQVNYAGNGALWSLSAEAFFYLLFPLLIVAISRRRHRVVVVAIAVAAIIILPIVLHPDDRTSVAYWVIYVFPVQRFAEFCCGAALGTVMRKGWKFPVPFPVAVPVAVAAYLIDGLVPTWAQATLVTFVPFILLIGSAAQRDVDGRTSFARNRYLVRLGEWSYAFYLVHQVTGFIVFLIVKRVLSGDAQAFVILTVSLGLSIVGAACLYYLVERPLEKRLRHAAPRPELLAS